MYGQGLDIFLHFVKFLVWKWHHLKLYMETGVEHHLIGLELESDNLLDLERHGMLKHMSELLEID